jgi:ArsR family transcriptional regulator
MNTTDFENQTSEILSVIGNPFRIKILLALGNGEACVCHLEAVLKKRQAFISQHLMVLRNTGVLDTRREGKYIFYRLADTDTFQLIQTAARLAGLEDHHIPQLESPGFSSKCCCPKCERELSAQKPGEQ